MRVSDALVGVVPSHRHLLVDVQRLDPNRLSSDNVLAAMARLGQARSVRQLGEAPRALADWAGRAEEPELVARLEAWINILVRPRFGVAGAPLKIGAGIPKGGTMTTLLDRIEQWTEEWLEQGREQGLGAGPRAGR